MKNLGREWMFHARIFKNGPVLFFMRNWRFEDESRERFCDEIFLANRKGIFEV